MVAESKSNFRLGFRLVVYREGEIWLAHCLELDIVGEGASAEEAVETAMEVCAMQIESTMECGDIESIFRAAPPEIWKMFAQGNDIAAPAPKRARSFVSQFEAREAALAP